MIFESANTKNNEDWRASNKVFGSKIAHSFAKNEYKVFGFKDQTFAFHSGLFLLIFVSWSMREILPQNGPK